MFDFSSFYYFLLIISAYFGGYMYKYITNKHIHIYRDTVQLDLPPSVYIQILRYGTLFKSILLRFYAFNFKFNKICYSKYFHFPEFFLSQSDSFIINIIVSTYAECVVVGCMNKVNKKIYSIFK